MYNKELSIWCRLPTVDRSWSAYLQTLEETNRTDSGHVSSMAFSPDSHILACGYERGNISLCTVKLWNPSTGQLRQTLAGHPFYILSIAFLLDGQLLASSCSDNTVKL
ncbi:WD40-repeat-containing domain protein [Aspergillus egyptiacus]|nr:WD40-repeat-containing domain protein [Aspergillus egyptiacus]